MAAIANIAQTDEASPSGAPVVEGIEWLHEPLIWRIRSILLSDLIQKPITVSGTPISTKRHLATCRGIKLKAEQPGQV